MYPPAGGTCGKSFVTIHPFLTHHIFTAVASPTTSSSKPQIDQSIPDSKLSLLSDVSPIFTTNKHPQKSFNTTSIFIYFSSISLNSSIRKNNPATLIIKFKVQNQTQTLKWHFLQYDILLFIFISNQLINHLLTIDHPPYYYLIILQIPVSLTTKYAPDTSLPTLLLCDLLC